MGAPVLSTNENYTWKEYLSWGEEYRCELINGVVYALASPNQKHQRVLRRLSTIIGNYLEGKDCELFISPSDVKLDEKTVVQPDLFIVCDESKLDGQFTIGAPDLIIEILSPDNFRIDLLLKYNKYLEAKVKEYWIVDPEREIITVLTLNVNKYDYHIFGETDKVKSDLLKDCIIELEKVFVQ